MRNLLFVFIGILTVCSGCTPEQTLLRGHIENYQGEMVRIWSRDNYDLNDTLQVNASGDFTYSFGNGINQTYALTVDGFEPYENTVYIGAGDQVEIQFSLLPNKTLKVEFAGDRVAENEYLRAFAALEGSQMFYSPEMRDLSFVDYKAKADAEEQKLQTLLDKISDSKVKEEFARRQHLNFQSYKVNYANMLSWREREGMNASDSDFTAFVKSINMNDPAECNTYMAWDIIEWYRKNSNDVASGNKYLDYLDWLDRLVTNPDMKNMFATDRMETALRASMGEPLEAVMERYNQICTNDSMRQKTTEKYQEYVRVYTNLMPGKVAPDFELISDSGDTVRLSDLKGQYVFIDVWATWCGGCVMQIPYMEKLQEHFADDKRIKLISISWDYTQKEWLDYLKKRPATWAQYIVDKKNMDIMKKEYRMTFIPRFLLLDPEGRIISIDYAAPSDPECVKMLEKEIR